MKKKFLLLTFTFTLLSAAETDEHKFTQEELQGINGLVSLAVKRPSWSRRFLRRYILSCWCATFEDDEFEPHAVYAVDSPGGTSALVKSFHLEGEE